MQRREKSTFRKRQNEKKKSEDGLMRLNKYIARAGICSRREADKFIEAGVVKVNGKVITQMGYKLQLADEVKFNDARIKSETTRYLLLNKPKNYSGRIDDTTKKRTVQQLITGACKEIITPIGRLGKNSTGLLLFTNDIDLIKKLTNPQKRIKEIYHLILDENLKSIDLKKLQDGITIGGKRAAIDMVSYISGKDKNEIGLEISMGGIKMVNLIFEQIGYKVQRIDRVFFAGLSKKDLPRKRYRFLSAEEVGLLKRL
tara:strand:+ start:103 stop:873 length:771 start_codon:yes stop_codon:yes gene_type:complete